MYGRIWHKGAMSISRKIWRYEKKRCAREDRLTNDMEGRYVSGCEIEVELSIKTKDKRAMDIK